MKESWKNIKKEGYQVPSGYFDDFEKNLKEEILLQTILKKDQGGFTIPDGYFDNLDTQINARLKPKNKIFTLEKSIAIGIVMSIAALLVVALLVIIPGRRISNFDDLTFTSMEEYLSEDGIQDYISNQDLNEIEASSSFIDKSSVSDDLIFEYLDNTIIEDDITDQ
ncbi:hypothetical protein ACH3O9_00120 [Leeuwenhoekiella sp. A16]|uniref:hypothetical protein n=1 Tax=unclassified Leeuwenhoekiella TaxID=2615029 RepID=UPI003A807D28